MLFLGAEEMSTMREFPIFKCCLAEPNLDTVQELDI